MASTYNPNIPTGNVKLNIDYLALRNNFTQLNTTYGIDHLPYTNGTSQLGYHTAIHLVPQAAPTATLGYGQIYNQEVNDGYSTDTTLYFLTGKNRNLQLTSNMTPAVDGSGNGFTFIPGGFIVEWGTFTSTAVGGSTPNCTVPFPRTFATSVYSVNCTVLDTTASRYFVILNSLANNQFTANIRDSSGSRAPGIKMYWMAIGK